MEDENNVWKRSRYVLKSVMLHCQTKHGLFAKTWSALFRLSEDWWQKCVLPWPTEEDEGCRYFFLIGTLGHLSVLILFFQDGESGLA